MASCLAFVPAALSVGDCGYTRSQGDKRVCPTTLAYRPQTVLPNDTRLPSTNSSAQRHSLTTHRQFCPTTLAHHPETVLPNDTRSPSRDSSAQRHSLTIQRQLCPTTLAHHPETVLPIDTRSPSTDSSAQRHSLTVHRQFCPTTLAHRPQTVLPNDTRSPSRDSVILYIIVFLPEPSLPLAENSGRLTWVGHSSRKSSATHSCQCVQYFRVFKQWYGCQCLGFLTCTQLLMRAIAHGGCTDTVRQTALEVDSWAAVSCRTVDSNPRHCCAGLFSRTPYQLSHHYPFLSLMWSLADRSSLTRRTSGNWFLSSKA